MAYSPDILDRGLDVVFCGINPAATAAADGHNFSSPSNRFWTVLHRSGFTDVRLRPDEEHRLPAYGCGITAVVTRPTPRASDVTAAEFRRAAPAFETKIRHYAPRAVAFLGKRALAAILSCPDLTWGRQPFDIAGAHAWLLPNPSGLNRNFTLDALVEAYAAVRQAEQSWRPDGQPGGQKLRR